MHTWYFNKSRSIEMENINFRDCGFPFRFLFVQRINITNCTYMNFSEAVLDIYNCQNVVLDYVTLQNNSGNGRLLESVRGNSGGVAIGYNMLPTQYTNPTLTVSNSVFRHNRALGFLSPEKAVAEQVFLGRGGGMALLMNESYQDIHAEITDCIFEDNMARLFGGGFYILTTSYESVQHVVNVQRNHFLENVGLVSGGGGGVQLSFLSSGDVNHPHSFTFSDCVFEGNRAQSGGGIYIFQDDNGNRVRLERCNFTDNSGLGIQNDLGAAVAFSYLVRFTQRVTSTRQEISNCSFVRNSGPNGVLSLGYTPMKFSGFNSFIGNQGASLRIVGSLVDFEGEIGFWNNSANREGVLHLLSFGQMRLQQGTRFVFKGNVGRLGSSIVVDTLASLLSFDDLLFNPRCFILYENRTATPLEWDDVSISFTRNEAIVSSSVYISQGGNVCSWFKQTPPYFNRTFLPDWPLWSYEDNENTGYLDSHNQLLSVGTIAQQFSLHPSNVSAWPGQRMTLSLVGLDEFNHETSTSTRLTFQPNQLSTQNITSENLQFDPQIVVQTGSEENHGLLENTFSFSYSVKLFDIEEVGNEEALGFVVTEEAFNTHPITSDNFTLYSLPCPGGYVISTPLNSDTMTCTCISIEEILFCEDDQDSITLKYGTWASYNPTGPSAVNLYFYECPPGYCSCTFNNQTRVSDKMCIYQYKQSDPDSQCVCDREGILCGQCRNSAGVSVLLNKCVFCSDGFLALIPLLFFLVAVVLVAIILIDRPLPEWIIPFLFYIQNAPYATQFYPETFEVVGKYLHYLSSATNLYFIYDFCLSSNLSLTHSYLLRYLPAFTAVLVLFLVWLIRKRIMKKKTLHNYGCWWCLLLLYSSVVHTSMSALHCPSIPHNGTSNIRWFMSGGTECFTGVHFLLGLLAIIMLILCIFFAVFAALLPSMKCSQFKNYKEPFTSSFKGNMNYWSGVELARRFIFLLALIPFPRNTVYAVLVLVISISLYVYNMPYKSKAANVLEVVVQLNFLILLLLELTTFVQTDLFLFSGDTSDGVCGNAFSSISYIVILLAPVYYAPLLVLIVVVVVYLIIYSKRYKKHSRLNTVTTRPKSAYGEVMSTNFTTQSLSIDHSQDVPLSAIASKQ